jgi:hypothetical protein
MGAEPVALEHGQLPVGCQRRPPACALAANTARAAGTEQLGVSEEVEGLERSHVTSFDVLN